jgi:hypothetical protein
MELSIWRVTVRGRFSGLDAASRATLAAELDDHDVVTAGAFTEAGTLTYDAAFDFFTFRYQLRTQADDRAGAEAAVLADARARAESHLRASGVGARDLKVKATNLADVWR